MFPFGSVPPLVGVPGQLLPPVPAHAQPLPVVSLPLLAQQYRLAAQPPLQLVQPPLARQLVIHPQLPRAPPPPPLLLRSPLRHTVVNPPVKANVLGAPCVAKSPNAVKAPATPPAVKVPPAVKESDGASEANGSAAVTLDSTRQKSEDRCEAVVRRETSFKKDTNGTAPEEIKRQVEKSEKPCAEGEEVLPRNVSDTPCSDVGNTKVRKMKHVMILDEDRNFCAELPLEKDNTLAPKLLQRHFPGVCGLTYRSSDCPHRQWIVLESGKLRAPKGGWEHDVYYCVFSKQSGGKWLHTFCHCSFSKPSKNKLTKSPIKSSSNKNNQVKTRPHEVSSKKLQSEEPDVYIVEEDEECERQRCSEIVVCSLPQWVTDERLREHFDRFGKVLTCVVQKDLVGGRYGLVKFRDVSSQEKALAEVFHRFGDTWCSVRLRS
ncbi:uncharacterized protein LOC124552541 [Schistocerca americana]|uniref:uncharacterized protein LOC124552541 n=1 Tax=Schistocerca americana TaxID=7009 RepID=UPI001F4F47D9|nr:uncharacterized protein LOC124552541 [Schistocerca americana]